jgi:putative DeoR family transcriptional regulator (stage III sporulation protein D)
MGKGESDMMYIAADKERCVILGTYIVENRATVRQAAARYGISKSTVHKDVTEVLCRVNRALYDEVAKVLEQNKSERHLRGGEATRRRHLAHGGLKTGKTVKNTDPRR